MNKTMRIGVLCAASIAQNRFMPALMKNDNFYYIGIAHANKEERFINNEQVNYSILERGKQKALEFCEKFGGKLYNSYQEMIDAQDIDAIYIPLPPALHYKWAYKALSSGKHVFLEKPSTISIEQTQELVHLARTKNLALCENYMFQYHSQLEEIKKMLSDGLIGDLRLVRISFGFPFRGVNDFRYNPEMGGGALLDCGGYTIRLADILLGETASIVDGSLVKDDRFSVDLYGNAVLRNKNGLTAQISFGMDNQYRCELELWGSTGQIIADRIFTAPPDFIPMATLIHGNERKTISFKKDDQFYKSLQMFGRCIVDSNKREEQWNALIRQATMVSNLQSTTIHQKG